MERQDLSRSPAGWGCYATMIKECETKPPFFLYYPRITFFFGGKWMICLTEFLEVQAVYCFILAELVCVPVSICL